MREEKPRKAEINLVITSPPRVLFRIANPLPTWLSFSVASSAQDANGR